MSRTKGSKNKTPVQLRGEAKKLFEKADLLEELILTKIACFKINSIEYNTIKAASLHLNLPQQIIKDMLCSGGCSFELNNRSYTLNITKY